MLRQSLATLPQTLDETYERILTSIPREDCVYAIRILQWLTFSARPLSIDEVAEVAAIDVAREPTFDRDEVLVDPLEALAICSSLVTFTTNPQRIITLAHYSVQEYLASDRIKQGSAKQYSMQKVECHKAMTIGSLGYLNMFRHPISEKSIKVSALARYSAQFWNHHLRKTKGETDELSRLVLSLFSEKGPTRLTWLRLYNPDNAVTNAALDLETAATPLYYAALMGLSKITKLLLDQGADVNAQCGSYGNALQAASFKGYEAVVQLLIFAGADVNAIGGRFGNALQSAAVNGHDRIVEALLNANAEVNMQGGSYGNALNAALLRTQETTVRILVESGADVGLDVQLKGAIHYAVDQAQCTSSLVSMLWQHGAPLNTIDVKNMTPLHYCVKHGHKTIMRQLIDAGVPIDSRVCRQDRAGRVGDFVSADGLVSESGDTALGLTSLHFAALTGDGTISKFLLEHGADPNALSEYYETPLHLTLRNTLLGIEYKDDWRTDRFWFHRTGPFFEKGKYRVRAVISNVSDSRKSVLDVLLADPRTSVTAVDNKGESPLHAIRYGQPQSACFVEKLVFRGAILSTGNASQQTPLHLASRAGDLTAVTTLLRMGAKVASTDERGLNALHYAAQSGHLQTMITVLDCEEAKVLELISSKDQSGQNVLHHSMSKHSNKGVEAVRWLLGQGVDGSELDDSGISPLSKLIRDSMWPIDLEISRLLLDHSKEDALFIDCDGHTLAHSCAMSLDTLDVHILRFLDEQGADLAKKDNDGRTVLHCAAIGGSLTDQSMEFLLNLVGIQAEEKDKNGSTALQYAIEEASKVAKSSTWSSIRRERTKHILLNDYGDRRSKSTSFAQLFADRYGVSVSLLPDWNTLRPKTEPKLE